MEGTRAPLIDVTRPAVAVLLLYLVAGIVGLAWLVLPHPAVDSPAALAAMSAAAVGGGALLVPLRRRRAPAWLGQVILAAATLTVSACVYFNGHGYSAAAFFYLWSSPYAFLGTRRAAVAHMLLLGGSFAAALAAGDPAPEAPGLWLVVMCSVGAVGMLARTLTAALRRTRDTMMAGFAGASAGMAAVGPDGRFRLVNPALCELLRSTGEQLVGEHVRRFVHADSATVVAEIARRVRAGGRGSGEFRYVRADGTTGWASATAVHVGGTGDTGDFDLVQVVDATARRTAQDRLRASEQRFARLFGDAPIGQVVTDLRGPRPGRLIMANPAVCALLGATEEQLLSASWEDLVHPDDLAAAGRLHGASGDRHVLELRLRRLDGSWLWTRWHTSSIAGDDGAPSHLISQVVDVTDVRRHAGQQALVARVSREALAHRDLQRVLDETLRRIAATFEAPFACLVERMADGRLGIRAHAGPQDVPGNVSEDGHGATALRLRRPLRFADARIESRFDVAPLVARGVTSGIAVPVDGPGSAPFGALCVHATDGRRFSDDDEACLEALASVLTSAIRRDAAESELLHRSLHDPLTGLPNRGLLLDRLARIMARAVRDGTIVSVLFLDLDDFKDVNDSIGHDAGDHLLCEIATRLSSALRPGDLLARFGGDEFVVLCEGGGAHAHLAVARRLLRAVARPVQLGGTTFLPRASVGVASAAPRHGATPTSLLRDADVALYRAKGAGKDRVEVFGAEMRAQTLRRIALAGDLRAAIEREQLRVALQPIVSLADGRVTGVEALARWTHPTHGEIEPQRFIRLAEEEGLIVAIDRWMLRAAVEQVADLSGLGVSVNVSRRRLGRPELVAELAEVLDRTGLDASRLTLEVTESALADDPEGARRVLGRIATMGVGVALDDFGTGQSSLSSLRDFPLRRLKLDRAFVRNLPGAALDRSIVRAVVDLASSLSLDVVAEGVASAQQAAALHELGCAHGQGFLFSPAVAPDELAPVVARIERARSAAGVG